MIIKATERSTYLDISKIEWEPTKYAGVYIKRLYEDPSGRQTTLTRMEPGAKLPRHRHVGIEQSYVLAGTLVDEDGTCTAGNFVRRRACGGSRWRGCRAERPRAARARPRLRGSRPARGRPRAAS